MQGNYASSYFCLYWRFFVCLFVVFATWENAHDCEVFSAVTSIAAVTLTQGSYKVGSHYNKSPKGRAEPPYQGEM